MTNYRIALILVPALLAFSGQTPAGSKEKYRAERAAATELMRKADYKGALEAYQRALKYADKWAKPDAYKSAGDAAILAEQYRSAQEFYARGISLNLDSDLDTTGGDSMWLKAVGVVGVLAGAAVDAQASQAGMSTSAENTTRAMEMLTGMKGPDGAKEYRSLVKKVSIALSDMPRQHGKKKAGAAAARIPMKPGWSNVPGAGLARIVTTDGRTCPAIRINEYATYISSATCLAANGTLPVTPWVLTHESGLVSWGVCRVSDVWTTAGKNRRDIPTGPGTDWAMLVIQEDCNEAFNNLGPPIVMAVTERPAGTGRLAALEYSERLGQIIPELRFCEESVLSECTADLGSHAAVWVETNERGWRFAGFLAPQQDALDDIIMRPQSSAFADAMRAAKTLGRERHVAAEAAAAARRNQ